MIDAPVLAPSMPWSLESRYALKMSPLQPPGIMVSTNIPTQLKLKTRRKEVLTESFRRIPCQVRVLNITLPRTATKAKKVDGYAGLGDYVDNLAEVAEENQVYD
jgi:hypothetical protein